MKHHARGYARVRSAKQLYPATSGALLAAAGVPLSVVHSGDHPFFEATWSLQLCAGAAACSLLLAAVAVVVQPRAGRIAATGAALGTLSLGAPYLAHDPLAALAALVMSSGALALLWRFVNPIAPQPRALDEGQAQGAAVIALALWFLAAVAEPGASFLDEVALGWAFLSTAILSVDWAGRHLRSYPGRATLLLATGAATLLLAPFTWVHTRWLLSSFPNAAAAALLLVRRHPSRGRESRDFWDAFLGNPERLFVGTFLGLCAAGTALLALPQCARSGEGIGLVDAAFTAASAVCVTGLIVLDTPVVFNGLGQFVLCALIQLGGLGIMTFSTAVLFALGRRMSLRHEAAVAGLLGSGDGGHLRLVTHRILKFTFVTEVAGALILAAAFVREGDSLTAALWRGTFTSISAFCNAGFALQSDSLIPYQNSPLILHSVGLLIVLGGLSPAAVFALPAMTRRFGGPVSAQARLVLGATALLVASGFILYAAFEWNDSLRDLAPLAKLHNAWFQSVTLRTAGFNSVDLVACRPVTVTMMVVWMFIGGSPGGTAGGIKTTTFAVLALSVVSAIRGQWTLEAFGKRVPERTRAKAAVIVALAATTGVLALVATQLTQQMPTRLAVFEVVSALATVGLSLGGTAQLDGVGKTIIVLCMFIGRVGSLTMLMFLASRSEPHTLGRPEEEIDVG